MAQGIYPGSPVSMVPDNSLPQGKVEQMMQGRDTYTMAGVHINFDKLDGVRLRHQIITLEVKQPNTRYTFDTVTRDENMRVVGVSVTSSELETDESKKSINDSSIAITIDNEEVLPDGFPCKLVSAKLNAGYYDNFYRINERANGSVVKGHYISSANRTTDPYKVFIILWCIANPKKS